MIDVINNNGEPPAPTFQNYKAMPTIDYIWTTPQVASAIQNPKNVYFPRVFTDHHLLSVDVHLPNGTKTGPGVWRLNPQSLTEEDYLQQLERLFTSVDERPIYETTFTTMGTTQTNNSCHVSTVWTTMTEKPQKAYKKMTRERAEASRLIQEARKNQQPKILAIWEKHP
jgi:hypothetical protein